MKKLTIKNYIGYGLLFLMFCFITKYAIDFYYYQFKPIEYKDCGKIVSKSNDEITIKHGTRTELYLNIQFEKDGFKSIEVEPTSYFKHKINDIVCYTFIKHENTTMLNHASMFLSFAFLCLFLLVLTICLNLYLFDYLFKKEKT